MTDKINVWAPYDGMLGHVAIEMIAPDFFPLRTPSGSVERYRLGIAPADARRIARLLLDAADACEANEKAPR
ncbi:MAG: hypothetical protein JSS20_22480 [Proteobacteria bacterium]|nr:hypothetical protein [Pseudomonadota bacterium]